MKTHQQKISDLEAMVEELRSRVVQLEVGRDRQELPTTEAAQVLAVSAATIKRRISSGAAKIGTHYSMTSSGRYLIKIGEFKKIL